MRIGISGGQGFIGSHVADIAEERGHQVVIFDRDRKRQNGDREVFLGDVMDDVAMTELAAHVDGIIHLAACLGTQETIQNPRPAALTNLMGGLNFLEACAQYGIPGVYICVGNSGMFNTYSISKTTVENFTTMFNKERGTRVNQVRLVNAVGPRQSVAPPYGPSKVRKIGPSFICRALTGAPIEIYGDGEQVSDLVHVRDGALALVLALERAASDVVFDRPVFVGTVQSHTVNEVAAQVLKASGSSSEIRHLPMRPGEKPGATIKADTSTLHLVGMDPADLKTMPEIIDETVEWFRDNWLPGYLQKKR